MKMISKGFFFFYYILCAVANVKARCLGDHLGTAPSVLIPTLETWWGDL